MTRERVRQIQVRASERAYAKKVRLDPFLAHLESLVPDQWQTFRGEQEPNRVYADVRTLLEGGKLGTCGEREVRRLITLVRAIVDRHPRFADDYPKLSFIARSLVPFIKAHERVTKAITQHAELEREANRTWTYEELAEAVLEAAGEPLHWSVRAERAEALGRRKSFYPTSFFNAVQTQDDKFARVDAGTYGLVAWGLRDVENYADIVASLLSKTGRPLSEAIIFQGVDNVRPVDRGSLKMMLDMNPRFYRSIEGTFGLRSWLPDRHLQTLRTPKWQIEDANSFARVVRAQARGYNVAELVERDRVSYPAGNG